MKLLELVESAAAGAGRHVIDLSEGLLARGHQVHLAYSPLRCDEVFTREVQRLREGAGLQAFQAPLRREPSTGDIGAMFRLRRYLHRHGPFDIVHCHSTKAGLVGRLGLAGCSVARLYTPHGFFTMDPTRSAPARRAVAAMEAALSRFCHGVIVVSRQEYAHALRIGIPAAKLCLIPNGVALDQPGLTSLDRAALRSQWGLAGGEVCIGFVGRLAPVKSPETMLRSFAAVASRSRTPARLIMVGDGPLAGTLRRLSLDLGLDARVIWLGARDARPLMQAFDVLALTSDSEGHPLVVLEAMAHGLPIVATAVGGIPETVQPGVNGYIAPVRGVAEIAATLDALVHDSALRERMGHASRALSLKFSSTRMVDQTVRFYDQVVSGTWRSSLPPDWTAEPLH
jgi:glycosyltransferase involved in cell wall biosynthesis